MKILCVKYSYAVVWQFECEDSGKCFIERKLCEGSTLKENNDNFGNNENFKSGDL